MTIFTTIHRVQTYMEIVEQIREGVRSGMILPGEKLPGERDLAAELGIGRQCLREALSVLQVLGIVEVRKGRGTFITQDAPQRLAANALPLAELGDPFEFMEARRILEPQIAGLAASRCSPAIVRELYSLLATMRERQAQGQPFEGEAKRFHLVVAEGCCNAALSLLVQQLIDNMGKQLWVRFKERSHQTAGRGEQSLVEHAAIAKAIAEKDAVGATRLMKQHLDSIVKNVLA